MSDHQEIEALIRRAQGGDVRAFEDLIARHIGVVRRFARAFARTDHEADDLAQEALIKVYRSITSYRSEAAFSTWLYALVRNCFFDASRSKQARQRAREDAFVPAEHEHGERAGLQAAQTPDEALQRAEERRALWTAIEGVPVEFRSALVLFDVEGLSYDEISAIERIAIGTVKSRLSRGRAHLRRILGGSWDGSAENRLLAGNRASHGVVSPAEKVNLR